MNLRRLRKVDLSVNFPTVGERDAYSEGKRKVFVSISKENYLYSLTKVHQRIVITAI